jgi:nicotinamidase-related amidase
MHMAEPKTLLQMAGANPAPPAISDSTIVVIDAQREYTDGKLPLDGVDAALAEIGKLLKRARALQVPVIHIQHQGKPGGAFGPDTKGFEIAYPADPAPDEAVLKKSLPNAFASTDLSSRLAALKKPNVILVGFQTHMCVEATARASIDLGFKATVVASATATRALPDALGGTALTAAEVQRNALAAISDRFATIVKDVDQLPD